MASIYDDLTDYDDQDDGVYIHDESDSERFSGVISTAQKFGEISPSVDPKSIHASELEDLEQLVIDLSRIDPSVFIQYVFEWPMQPCHCEWMDLLSSYPRVILWAPVEHGKTSQMSIARPIWELGVNANARIAIFSNTSGQAIKCLAVIKSQIELNPRISRVFPKLKRERRTGRRALWHDDQIIVQRDDLDNKDPSIQALGVLGAVMGARIDLALLDDVLDFENTLHDTARKRMIDWHDSSVESRLTATGREAMIGTAWHREDLMPRDARR